MLGWSVRIWSAYLLFSDARKDLPYSLSRCPVDPRRQAIPDRVLYPEHVCTSYIRNLLRYTMPLAVTRSEDDMHLYVFVWTYVVCGG